MWHGGVCEKGTGWYASGPVGHNTPSISNTDRMNRGVGGGVDGRRVLASMPVDLFVHEQTSINNGDRMNGCGCGCRLCVCVHVHKHVDECGFVGVLMCVWVCGCAKEYGWVAGWWKGVGHRLTGRCKTT